MSAVQRAKKYMFAIATVYVCYLTQGVQSIIFSQNQTNFYTQWGYTDATAGAAAVAMAITWTGVGKFISVWAGGEFSDRIGRKIPAIIGAILYVISFSIMLVTTNATVACFAGFLSGLATSGFWDGSLYPAVAEANPKYGASLTIGIKFVISLIGIAYPLLAAINSGPSWHINIWIPIVLSVVCVVMAAFTPFIYDDKLKEHGKSNKGATAKNKVDDEIQRAKDSMLQPPNKLTNFITLFFGFLIMFIMFGAQQYSKEFGITNLGLDPTSAAGLTSVYTVGSVIAVLFWAWMMGKLRWSPIKVIFLDSVLATLGLAIILLAAPFGWGAWSVFIGIAVLGFSAAGGMLQTGVSLRQQMVPGPRGRNVGMYYTFMGFASVFLPFIVGAMITPLGSGNAVWIMMILLLLGSIICVFMSVYVIMQYKRQFGYSAMERVRD